MNIIHYNGFDINPDKVVSVGPVDSIQTGSLSCSWEYGFTVFLEGNKVEIIYNSSPDRGYAGGTTRDWCKEQAEKMRKEFMRLLK